MKLRIDSSGWIWIERAGKLRPAFCPFTAPPDDGRRCGDWCPLFGEPAPGLGAQTLLICQDRILSGEVTDERKAK
jgi:hypothetical protein